MENPTIRGVASTDQKRYNFTIVYNPPNGLEASESTANEIRRVKPSFSFTTLPVGKTIPFEQDLIEETVASSKMILAILSKDCLADAKFVFALDCALFYKVRIMLLHDQASCFFPGENEQPDSLMKGGVFKDKAVTFMKQYVDTCVDQILRKFQRFLDSKKQYDFLVLIGRPVQDNDYPKDQPLSQNESHFIKMFIRSATHISTSVLQEFSEEEDPSDPKPDDTSRLSTRDIPDSKKSDIESMVSSCHSVFYLPQGRRGNKQAVISRQEMYIYEMCAKHNTTIHIIDQHGVYGVLLLKYTTRYGISNVDQILELTSLHLPYPHIGIQIINKELKRGGCKSLATNTRVFLSHKRSSAQGMAGRIYEGLRDDYYCFLDSEADFDLHDLEIFVFILSEGILDSFWCLQELRSAIANNKRILIVRDYRYALPETLPDDLSHILKNSRTLDYMAEFYTPFLHQLKQELGVSDEIVMTCDSQVSMGNTDPNFLQLLKKGEIKEEFFFNVVPDATITDLSPDIFIRYFRHYGNDPKNLVNFPSKWNYSIKDVQSIAFSCPNYRGGVTLGPIVTDFDIVKLFNGKQLLKLTSVAIGDEYETKTGASSGESIKAIVKNLPSLSSLFVYHCRMIEPGDWKCIGNSGIKKLGVLGSNYKPVIGENIPGELEYVFGVKEVYDAVLKEALPNIKIMHARTIQEKV